MRKLGGAAVVLALALVLMLQAAASAEGAIEYVRGGPVGPRQYEFAAWTMTVRNNGNTPVDHIEFRLNVYFDGDRSLLYSQVHRVDVHLDPKDVLTAPTFKLKQKIEVGWARIYWNAETVRAW
jgi:hypothetical protein